MVRSTLTAEEVREQIERATKLVESWPKWKQNILVNSGKPSFDTPREPVDNFDGEHDGY